MRRLVAGTGASDASSISGTANARPVSDAPPARRTWPVRLQPSAHPTPSERHEVEMQNANLRRRLANQYAAGRDSQLVREGKGRPVDGLAMWARRLAIYDATDARRGDARASAKHETRGRKLLRATPSSRGVNSSVYSSFLSSSNCARFMPLSDDDEPIASHVESQGCSEKSRSLSDCAQAGALISGRPANSYLRRGGSEYDEI